MDFKKLDELIIKYKKIAIFRHLLPDYDAFGSQLGLATLIKENYKGKKIYVNGKKSEDMVNKIFEHDFEECVVDKDTLVIICDTANAERIDGDYSGAKDIVKIDHHPGEDNFGTVNYVSPDEPATSQILFHTIDQLKWKISKKSGFFLAAGIIGDTGRFRYAGTNSYTHKCMSRLLDIDVDLRSIYEGLYVMVKDEFRLLNYIRHHANFKLENTAFFIAKKGFHKKFNIPYETAKNSVFALSGIHGIKVWAYSSYDEYIKRWRVSMRSDNIKINHIAEKFGGGGHKFACAARLKTKGDVMKLLKEVSIEANK